MVCRYLCMYVYLIIICTQIFQICVRGSCIPSSTDLTPVDGQWGAFGPFSACTRSCGIGVRYRERQCNNPT